MLAEVGDSELGVLPYRAPGGGSETWLSRLAEPPPHLSAEANTEN